MHPAVDRPVLRDHCDLHFVSLKDRLRSLLGRPHAEGISLRVDKGGLLPLVGERLRGRDRGRRRLRRGLRLFLLQILLSRDRQIVLRGSFRFCGLRHGLYAQQRGGERLLLYAALLYLRFALFQDLLRRLRGRSFRRLSKGRFFCLRFRGPLRGNFSLRKERFFRGCGLLLRVQGLRQALSRYRSSRSGRLCRILRQFCASGFFHLFRPGNAGLRGRFFRRQFRSRFGCLRYALRLRRSHSCRLQRRKRKRKEKRRRSLPSVRSVVMHVLSLSRLSRRRKMICSAKRADPAYEKKEHLICSVLFPYCRPCPSPGARSTFLSRSPGSQHARAPRLLTHRGAMADCGVPAVHSDRIAQDFHLIPYSPPLRAALKNVCCLSDCNKKQRRCQCSASARFLVA